MGPFFWKRGGWCRNLVFLMGWVSQLWDALICLMLNFREVVMFGNGDVVINGVKVNEMKLNGLDLPGDFKAVAISGRVAISADGRYAVVEGGVLTVRDLPEDGKIKIDGRTIIYDKESGEVTLTGGMRMGSSVKGGTVGVIGDNVTITGGITFGK